jgi:hypothetical protein
MTGDLVGTLRYMSPEQALGGRNIVDHRTDVYSLGATLYELLTLRPLFAGGDRQELLGRIASEEPQPPRALDRTIPVELETIILKAVSKSPADRYASAQEMGDDLRRFLQDRPIRAKRPTLLDKATKWARRHRAWVASAAVILFMAAAASLAATVMIAQEQSKTQAAYERERQRAVEAVAERARAQANYELARKAVDDFGQLEADGPMDGPPAIQMRRELLKRALVYYQAFIEQRRDDPASQAELEGARTRIINILSELSSLEAFFLPGWYYILLQNRRVQEELGLKAEQVAKIHEFAPSMMDQGRKAASESRGLLAEDRQQRFREVVNATDEFLKITLKPEQIRRLKQIAVQTRGPHAFADREVAEFLKLNSEQRRAIDAILERDRKQRRSLPEHRVRGQGPLPSGGPSRTIAEILSLLTPAQQSQWKELTGQPFDGAGMFPPPRLDMGP